MENSELLKRGEDLARRCENKGCLTSTGFLTPAEQYALAHDAELRFSRMVFRGGHEDFERGMAFFLPDYMEEAEAIARLLRRYGLSQQQAAEKLGRSQSAVANKLRLLRLEEPVVDALHRYGLTERHARALLRLCDGEQRLRAVEHIGKAGMNVAAAEAYIDRLAAENQTTPPHRRSAYIIKDVRLFLNSVERGIRLMQGAGVGAQVARQDTDSEICLTVRIPKPRRPAAG